MSALANNLRPLGMRLSLPYNFDPRYADVVMPGIADMVHEVFLPVHWTVAATSRPRNGPASRRHYLSHVDALQRDIGPVRLNFVANQRLDRLGRMRVVDEILDLAERFPGAAFTVHALDTAIAVREARPDLEVGPSTLSGVASVLAASYWQRYAGCRMVTVAREINRRPALLRRIRATGVAIRVVARDQCLPECPWADDHKSAIAAHDIACTACAEELPASLSECRAAAEMVKRDPATAFLPAQITILPGHLPRLAGIVDVVKLEGRLLDSGTIRSEALRFLEARSLRQQSQHSWEEPPEAWDRLATCERDCFHCDWCARHIRILPAREPTQPAATPLAEPGPTRADPIDAPSPVAVDAFRVRLEGSKASVDLVVEPAGANPHAFVHTMRFDVSYLGSACPDPLGRTIERFARLLDEVARCPGDLAALEDTQAVRIFEAREHAHVSPLGRLPG